MVVRMALFRRLIVFRMYKLVVSFVIDRLVQIHLRKTIKDTVKIKLLKKQLNAS